MASLGTVVVHADEVAAEAQSKSQMAAVSDTTPDTANASDPQSNSEPQNSAETALVSKAPEQGGHDQASRTIHKSKNAFKRASRVQEGANKGVRLAFNNLGNSYAVSLLGSYGDGNTSAQVLRSSGVRHKSLGIEVEGKVGKVLNADLRAGFAEKERTLGENPFAQQPSGVAPDNRRALGEFRLKANFLDDRIAVTASRRASSFAPFEQYTRDKGLAEDFRLMAVAWQSGGSKLSITGASTRTDANYREFSEASDIAMLQVKNKETHQLRSDLKVGRVGLFVSDRDTRSLIPDSLGHRPRQSDIETGASLKLSDLRGGTSENFPRFVLAWLPDSIWVSSSMGSVERDEHVTEPDQIAKSAIGASRNWSTAAVNLSYWQSKVQGLAQLPEDAQWRGHGMDVAGNLYARRWSVSGNLSLYSADNIAVWNNTAENSLNGSLFLNWKGSSFPKLSAGVTNYSYQTNFYDYYGAEQSGFLRYQVAVDSSPLLPRTWSDQDMKLTVLASFQEAKNRSQWSKSDIKNDAGNVFIGFRFAGPILP